MKTLKKNYTGSEVFILRDMLGIPDTYDSELYDEVLEFQKNHGLEVDGIVGQCTWMELYCNHRGNIREITSDDYSWIAKIFDIEPEALKAVKEVESGGSGFLASGRPVILFEAHIFWKELEKLGINPQKYLQGNEDILGKTWNKKLYYGGEKEWIRLEKARRISKEAADSSASWGLFQVLGNNYKSCGCRSIEEFVQEMERGEFYQLRLTVEFLRQSGLFIHLRNHNWSEFARRYNGPGYKENKYDTKLEEAYRRLKNE